MYLFVERFGITLYGIDILVCEDTGKHLIIDCNYFSSYTGISIDEIIVGFDTLISEKLGLKEEEHIEFKNHSVESGMKYVKIAIGLGLVVGAAAFLFKKIKE